jgi:geranylgeranyl diphosphate synthase, type I
VVAVLTSVTPSGRELAALYHRDQPLTGTDLARAAGLIDNLLVQAMCDLQAASPTERAAEELGALARLATHRDH